VRTLVRYAGLVIAALVIAGSYVGAQSGPPARPASLSVFLDCNFYCDEDFVRTELTFVNWVRDRAAALGWPQETVHYEHFAAPQPGAPFDVTLAVSDKTIRVDEQQSLLEAIEAAGVDPPYLCRGGVCGQCETNVISYDGKFIHNDHWLSEEDHRSGCKIMPCVSRFEGKSLVLER